MTHDLDVNQLTGHQLVSAFLMASWLYYQEDESVIPDATYDAMALRLANEWDQIRHPNKGLLTPDDLAAGSGFAIPRNSYPWWVQRHSREYLMKMANEFESLT